tara:strand:- start:10599 stop:11057 length:459 start_codon:yes stop_codon:yes gene_type:complete
MAVYSYGANNISFDTFRTWANGISAQANTSLTTALGDFHPANAAPFLVSEFAPNTSIFYGGFAAGTGGTVSLTAPYAVAAGASFSVKNFLISTYTLTAVAATAYPWVFHSWRTAASGGGTQISTSATLTLTNVDSIAVGTFYAYFTTTHLVP